MVPVSFYQDGCLGFVTIHAKVGKFAMPTMTIAKWDYEECGDLPVPPTESVPPSNNWEEQTYSTEERIILEGVEPVRLKVKMSVVSKVAITAEYGQVPEEIRNRATQGEGVYQAFWESGTHGSLTASETSARSETWHRPPIFMSKWVSKRRNSISAVKTYRIGEGEPVTHENVVVETVSEGVV